MTYGVDGSTPALLEALVQEAQAVAQAEQKPRPSRVCEDAVWHSWCMPRCVLWGLAWPRSTRKTLRGVCPRWDVSRKPHNIGILVARASVKYQRIRVVKCTNLVWTDLEVKIRLLAEVLDILFDQMCQLARPPNVDPVIDGTDEAITLCHKCSTLVINEHESQ